MRVRLDTTQARGCARLGCYNPPPHFRHHLGNDALLAHFSRRVKKNYYRWTSCAKVCDECHMTIHFLYEQELPLDLWKKWSPHGIWRLREKFISLGKRFLAGKIPVPKVTAYFRAQWQESSLTYRARLEASSPKAVKRPVTNPKFNHET